MENLNTFVNLFHFVTRFSKESMRSISKVPNHCWVFRRKHSWSLWLFFVLAGYVTDTGLKKYFFHEGPEMEISWSYLSVSSWKL